MLNNKGSLSIYVLVILILLSGMCSLMNYKAMNLIETTSDYKESFKKFYDDEAMLYSLFYDEALLKNKFDEKIRRNPYIDLKYNFNKDRDIECEINYIKDKKEYEYYIYAYGNTRNITRFELISKIINDIYTSDSLYINYNTYDRVEIDKFFYTIKNWNGERFSRSKNDNLIDLEEENLSLRDYIQIDSTNIISNLGDVVISSDEELEYKGILYVRGDLKIDSNIDIRGMILIEDGDLIITEGVEVNITGGVVINNNQDCPVNLQINTSQAESNALKYSKINKSQIEKVYYGAYLPNFVEIKPAVIKIY